MKKLSTQTEIIRDMIESLEHDYKYNPSRYPNGISWTKFDLEKFLEKLT